MTLLTLSAICLLAAILYAAEECREDARRARQRRVVDAEYEIVSHINFTV